MAIIKWCGTCCVHLVLFLVRSHVRAGVSLCNGPLPLYVTYVPLCKSGGFHGGDYEEWCLLGCYAVWLL
jgi:hypothetical protein